MNFQYANYRLIANIVLIQYNQDNLKQNRLELKKAQNKDVETVYRQKFFELHVTKAIDKDVRDYSVALEKCLMEFHREKMENINLIIRLVLNIFT